MEEKLNPEEFNIDDTDNGRFSFYEKKIKNKQYYKTLDSSIVVNLEGSISKASSLSVNETLDEDRRITKRDKKIYNIPGKDNHHVRGFSFKQARKHISSNMKLDDLYIEMREVIEKVYFPDVLQINLNLKIANNVFKNMNHILKTKNVEFFCDNGADKQNDNLSSDSDEIQKIRNLNKEMVILYVFGLVFFIIFLIFINVFI